MKLMSLVGVCPESSDFFFKPVHPPFSTSSPLSWSYFQLFWRLPLSLSVWRRAAARRPLLLPQAALERMAGAAVVHVVGEAKHEDIIFYDGYFARCLWLLASAGRRLLGRLLEDEPTGSAFSVDFTDRAAAQAIFEEGFGSLLTDGVHVSSWSSHPPPLLRHPRAGQSSFLRLSFMYGPAALAVRRASGCARRRQRSHRTDGRSGRHVWQRCANRNRPPLVLSKVLIWRFHVGRTDRPCSRRHPYAVQCLLMPGHLRPRRLAAQRNRMVRQ